MTHSDMQSLPSRNAKYSTQNPSSMLYKDSVVCVLSLVLWDTVTLVAMCLAPVLLMACAAGSRSLPTVTSTPGSTCGCAQMYAFVCTLSH